MIQFLRFQQSMVEKRTFHLPTGIDAVKFFLKRVLYLFLFIYSTLFIAVAIPFFKTPFPPVYVAGGMATVIFLCRFINHIRQYLKYGAGSIEINEEGIIVTDKNQNFRIPADKITYIEHNVFGNMVIREKYNVTSFPYALLAEKDREVFRSLFQDMSPKRTRMHSKIWELVDAITVALILAVHIIQFVVQAYFIPTGSMTDTLIKNDHLFVEKITYGPVVPQMMGMDKPYRLKFLSIRDVERRDIVIFKPPHEKEKDYIKRCIALPGEKLEIKNGFVFINGKKLEEPYAKGRTYDDPLHSKVQGIVPEGKVVVMGDNRENSSDGRVFGYLDIAAIKGRAFFLYWNRGQIANFDFSRFGLIK